MSGRGRFRNRNRGSHSLSSVAKETTLSLAADSPVLALFKDAATKLNDRQDRHERCVKFSRDITIESKRIIFLLHSGLTKETTEKAVEEANKRLQMLIKGPIKSVGLELENRPAYLHSRAVTAGFQEFIEARTLCSILEKGEIITYPEVQKELTFTVINDDEEERTMVTMLTETDYMLGIADLTGELMRRAINCISSGESEDCFYAWRVVKELYKGYLGLFGIGKEIARKMSTTRSNLLKIETAGYALKIRGGETPLPLLLPPPAHHDRDWESNTNQSDDEGFY